MYKPAEPVHVRHGRCTSPNTCVARRKFASRALWAGAVCFGCCVVAVTAETVTANIAWNAPSANEDGTALTDLAGFRVYEGTRSGAYERVVDVGGKTRCSYPNLELGRVYYFAVTAYDQAGNESAFSPELRYEAPAASDRRPSLVWHAVPGAEWYRVWINRDGEHYHSTWLEQTASTWSFDFDIACGSYSWWVQSWSEEEGHGQWVGPYAFSIACCTPASPDLLVPVDICEEGGAVTYVWAADPCVDWHHLWIERGGEQWYVAWHKLDAPGDQVSLTVDGHGFGSYTWWVRGYGPDGNGPWSDAARLAIGMAGPTSPHGSASVRPVLTWDDSCSRAATWYRFWVNRDNALFREQWVEAGDVTRDGTEASYQLRFDLPAGHFTWWMQTWVAGHYGPWSEGLPFTVE